MSKTASIEKPLKGSNNQCSNLDKCAYFYPTGNDEDDPNRNATEPIRFYHTCCCSEPLCNERVRTDCECRVYTVNLPRKPWPEIIAKTANPVANTVFLQCKQDDAQFNL